MAEKHGIPPTRPRSAPPPLLWRRRSLLGASLGAGAALALSGCGGRATTAAGETSTLKWGWDLPTSWDPVTSSAGWDVHGLSLVHAGLTELDQKRKAVPSLASSSSYDHGALVAPVPDRLRGEAHTALPALVLHGAADPVTAAAAQARALAARLPQATLGVPREGRHDVLNDAPHRSTAATVVLRLECLRGGPSSPPALTIETGPAGPAGPREERA
jgi:hypothetical protein